MRLPMRYRRRFFIPVFHNGQQVAHLVWRDGAMEAWIDGEETVGRYPTRKEAASALFEVLYKRGIRRWTTHQD